MTKITLLKADTLNPHGIFYTEEALRKMAQDYENLCYDDQKKSLVYSGKLPKIGENIKIECKKKE